MPSRSQKGAARDYERNLALLAGREPIKELCDAFGQNVQIFTYLIIETAIFGELADRDLLDAISSSPIAAAELFRAARTDRLPMLGELFVKTFMQTIGFEYPKPGSAPEDAAVELATALDRAVSEARRLKASIAKRPKGHQSDDDFDTFVAHLISAVAPDRTREQMTDLIGTAILMVAHKGRAILDSLILPREAQEAAHARLLHYEQLDSSAIVRRVARITKKSICQDETPDANRARA